VFLSCDGKFLPHAMTAVASVLANGTKSNRYDIMVIVHDVDPDDLAVASEWARQFGNCRLRFLDAGECLDLRGMRTFHVTGAFPLAVYFRLFAPAIFPNHNTILYLDSDLVALADVAEAYRHDLGDALIAACRDFKFEDELRNPYSIPGRRFLENAARCGIEYLPGDPYFNSGVMVMNLRAMREEGTQERFLAAIRRMEKPMLPDQDVLNLVCKDRVRFIHPSWNCMEWMAKPERPHVKILHFTEKKPWDFRYSGGNGGCYWLYSRMSPQQFHRRVAGALLRQSTVSANIKSFVRLAFHLARCLVLPPFANAARREKFARRKHAYRLDMLALFHHWRNRASLRFAFAASAAERRRHKPSRSGTLFGESIPECLEAANK
jgi:lipopolysaccharide biosynthesis glycosyltransferase